MEKNTWKALSIEANTHKPTDFMGTLHLLLDLALTAAAIYLSQTKNVGLWLVGQTLLLVCIWRWFGILHSAVHQTFFRSKFGNKISGRLASIFALLPFEAWKWSHLTHHRWTGYREKDPSLSLPKSSEISAKTRKFLDFCWKWHLPIFTLMIAMKKNHSPDSPKSSGMLLVGIGQLFLIVLLKWDYLQVFALPVFFYLVTSDIMILSQHNLMELPIFGEGKSPIPLHEQDQYTRTLTYPAWVSSLVFLHFDKHSLHHLYPYVPHYSISKMKTAEHIVEIPLQEWLKESKKVPGHQVYLD